MKILHVIDSMGIYGAEVMLLNLIAEHKRQGVYAAIASVGTKSAGVKDIEREASQRGIPVQAFRMKPGPNFLGALKLIRYAHAHAFDLLHSHGFKGNILLGLTPPAIRRLPVMATLHGWTATQRFSKIMLYQKVDQFSLKFIDTVVLVTRAALCRPVIRGLNPKKVVVIENGLSPVRQPQPFTRAPDFKCPGEARANEAPDERMMAFFGGRSIIGSIGRLSNEKGYGYLLEAFRRLKAKNQELALTIIGEGDERSFLEAMIRRFHLENDVLLAGFKPDAREYMKFFDVFVLPSLTEGLPITILEAMQEKIPIVASSVGGIPYVLRDGISARLVPPEDSEKLAAAIESILNDPDAARRMSQVANHVVRTKYSSEAMAEQYIRQYRCTIASFNS